MRTTPHEAMLAALGWAMIFAAVFTIRGIYRHRAPVIRLLRDLAARVWCSILMLIRR